jgi:crossover junction endodeoxyribonuclease RuvC
MGTIVVGIDPGKSGAVCVLGGPSGCEFFDTPTLGAGTKGRREYDAWEMAHLLKLVNAKSGSNGFCVAIERQQAMPAMLHGRVQGGASTFSTGYGYGLWMGIVVALAMPFEIVSPVSWHKAMLADMPKGMDSSRLKALRLFPDLGDQLKRKKDHGRADALLIAEYIRRKLNGQRP